MTNGLCSTGVFDYGHGGAGVFAFRWASGGLLFCLVHVYGFVAVVVVIIFVMFYCCFIYNQAGSSFGDLQL